MKDSTKQRWKNFLEYAAGFASGILLAIGIAYLFYLLFIH